MEASYPDLGSVKDSKEWGPEESEEVREGAGEGGHDSFFGGAPLPKYLGQVSGNSSGVASQQGPTCHYQVQMDLLWLLSWPGWSKVLCQSPGLLSSILSIIISEVALLLCPCRYQLICNFHSNSLLHTKNKPLALPSVHCEVSIVVATIFKSSIQKISKILK